MFVRIIRDNYGLPGVFGLVLIWFSAKILLTFGTSELSFMTKSILYKIQKIQILDLCEVTSAKIFKNRKLLRLACARRIVHEREVNLRELEA